MFGLSYITSLLLLGAGILAISGCSSDIPPAPSHVICPTLVTYTKKQQADASAELKSHPDLSVLHFFMSDYAGLRDQVRACKKGH